MKIIRAFATTALFLTVLAAGFYLFWLYPRYTVPILTYHDFGYGKGITVTPENFESQMRYLKDKGYNVISLEELVEGIKRGKGFTHHSVVITMDDGCEDNYTYAYPVLKSYGFPATIFLIAGNIGAKAGFLSWEEAREMSGNRISFGGHTRSHVYLSSIEEKDVLWDEIAGCKEVIERHIGAPADYFSYPIGGFTQEIKTLVEKAGYKGACSTNRGSGVLNRPDPYELNRISIRNSDNAFRFRAKLSGYYNVFRKRKSGD